MHFPCHYLFQHFVNVQTRLTPLRTLIDTDISYAKDSTYRAKWTHTHTHMHTYIHTYIHYIHNSHAAILPVISTADINTSCNLLFHFQCLTVPTLYACENTSHYRWFCTDLWNQTRYFKRVFYQNHNWQNKNVSFFHISEFRRRIPKVISLKRSDVALRQRRTRTSTFSFLNI